MRKFIRWCVSWFRELPGEDGLAEYQCDDPHDPQVITRIIHNYEDYFIQLERPRK